MKIDAEVFFWKNEKQIRHPLVRTNKSLQQQFLPEQISQSLQRNGIGGCIACVAEPAEVETRFLAELAMTHPEIRGVIGWTDLLAGNAPEKITEFQTYAPIRGYWLEINNERFPGEATMEKIQESGYSLDISAGIEINQVRLNQWVASHPGQSFILQRCGNPDLKRQPSAEWEKMIRDLAENQHLSCKISGLLENSHWKSWKPADFYPFLEIIFESFGPDRLLFASDWPFLLLAGIYVQWKSLLEKYLEKFNPEEQEKFFGGNAARIYRI